MSQKSVCYQQMMAVAAEYYRLLGQAPDTHEKNIGELKLALDELLIPYNDDAAFTAFLKMKRDIALHEVQL